VSCLLFVVLGWQLLLSEQHAHNCAYNLASSLRWLKSKAAKGCLDCLGQKDGERKMEPSQRQGLTITSIIKALKNQHQAGKQDLQETNRKGEKLPESKDNVGQARHEIHQDIMQSHTHTHKQRERTRGSWGRPLRVGKCRHLHEASCKRCVARRSRFYLPMNGKWLRKRKEAHVMAAYDT